MAYRRNFRPMPEPQFPQGPENPSTATTLHFGELEFDRSFESKKTFELFKINKPALIGGILKASTSPEAPVTEQNLRDALEEGKRFRPIFPPDGQPRICFRCGKKNQPVITSYFYFDKNIQEEKEGSGGNFRGMSEDKLKKYSEELVQRSNEYTAEVFGGTIPADVLSRVVEVCPSCKKEEDGVEIRRSHAAKREVEKAQSRGAKEEELDQIMRKMGDTRPHFQRDFNLSQAKERLLEISDRIQGVISDKETEQRKRAFDDNLGRRSRAPRTEGERGGFRGRGRDDRPRKEKRDWNGVLLELATADRVDQLVAEGVIENTLEALTALSEQQIVDFGLVEFPEQAPHVRLILLGAKKRQEEAAVVSRVSGTGTATLGERELAKKRQEEDEDHDRREKSQGGRGGKKFREPRRNPKYDYNR